MDKQWHNILLQIRSDFTSCPLCGKPTFIDPMNPHKTCIYCQKPMSPYAYLKVSRFTIPLVEKQIIYDCLVTSQTDYKKIAGEVVLKNDEAGIINQSAYPWTVTLLDGKVRIVNPGMGMPIRKGLKVKFGNQGETGELT